MVTSVLNPHTVPLTHCVHTIGPESGHLLQTSGHPEIQRGKLATCGAATSFANILVGGEEIAAGRAEKPAASIFYAACKLAGCEPHEVPPCCP